MNVDTMRAIDRYAGVPISFVLGIFYWLASLVMPKKTVPISKVLFIELSEMGSAIIADPAMRRLRDGAGAQLYFVIFKDNAVSLSLLDTIPEQNIYKIRDDSLFTFVGDVLGFLIWCRKQKIDTVVDLELFSRATSILTALSGASNRAGFDRGHEEGLYRGNFLTHPVTYNPHVHVSLNFMSLTLGLLNPQKQLPYNKQLITRDDIQLARADITDNQQKLAHSRMRELYPQYDADKHRLLLVNANASDLLPQRRWMPDRFAEVVTRILERYPDVLVVMTGAPKEKPQAADICDRVGQERCINSAGFFMFEELLPLYSIASAMLSNDSGPPHFASVTALKTFVIFGPETPALYGSLGNSEPIYAGLACSPCVSAQNHRKTSCTDNQCLIVITAEDVFKRVSAHLDTIAHDS
jgi:ADP-heptose:LPS heptosyltransferase